jgi:hypothetical protein
MNNQNFVRFDQQTGAILSYPRLDDGPVLGLDSRYIVLRVVRDPVPSVGPGQQASQTRSVDVEARELRWGWSVVDLSPPPPEPPNYLAFYDALLASQVYGAVVTTTGKSGDQAAAMTVFLGAIQDALNSRENRLALQQAIWLLLDALQDQLNATSLSELHGLMELHHLSNIYSLFPMPPAETVGQTWTDPIGLEWVVVQARDGHGQFMADDPATPERESLVWEKV